MGLVEQSDLISQLVPPLDKDLTTKLINEFVSMERRYIQRDWEPAELDGGQFCELLAAILYYADSSNANPNKDFREYADYIENNNVQHAVSPRSDAIHLTKVLRTIYKFRSQRGAVHIAPNYSPNQMDAKFIVESVRWCMNDTLRIFWNSDRNKVAKVIREILQFDVPSIGVYEGRILVQRTDVNAEEEILLLLHYAGESGFTRTELGQFSRFSPSMVTNTLKKLTSSDYLQVIELAGKRYRLMELGSKRIREELAEKLLLQ